MIQYLLQKYLNAEMCKISNARELSIHNSQVYLLLDFVLCVVTHIHAFYRGILHVPL